MPFFLECLDDQRRWFISDSDGVYIIGRAEDCDIRLESRKVSRHHCCVAQVNDYIAVRDLASTNGIRINNQDVLEGRLYPGDILLVGPYRLRVVWQPEPARRHTPPPVSAPPSVSASPPQVAAIPMASPPASPSGIPPAAPRTVSSSPAKKTSLLEDSNLFKLLESEDPLTGGQR
ncbi:MAG: FHA domain-containing protein [Gemmatales bacterium]|nr:FHA domain-containing protein [Gemmatales bacterium]MDW7995232.1 FHA domain-containing protein [Gemmatales bacterium]